MPFSVSLPDVLSSAECLIYYNTGNFKPCFNALFCPSVLVPLNKKENIFTSNWTQQKNKSPHRAASTGVVSDNTFFVVSSRALHPDPGSRAVSGICGEVVLRSHGEFLCSVLVWRLLREWQQVWYWEELQRSLCQGLTCTCLQSHTHTYEMLRKDFDSNWYEIYQKVHFSKWVLL